MLKHVFRLPSGNQPTAEDLEATRNWNSTFSSFDGNFYNFPDQLDIRAHRQRLKQDGALVIKRLSDQFPIQPDDPYVVIEDSEYPAFSSWHYGELMLSVSAADAVLRHYDAIAFEDGDFCVTNLAIHYKENGSPKVQRIHFYLGNQNGCLTEYLRAYGEWFTKENNKDPENVVAGTELVSLSKILSAYMTPAIIKVEYAPWLQAVLSPTDTRDSGDLSDDISDEERLQAVLSPTDTRDSGDLSDDISDEEIRDCVLSLSHDDESALVADALIEILAERDSQKALELYKEWTASQDQSSSAEVAEI